MSKYLSKNILSIFFGIQFLFLLIPYSINAAECCRCNGTNGEKDVCLQPEPGGTCKDLPTESGNSKIINFSCIILQDAECKKIGTTASAKCTNTPEPAKHYNQTQVDLQTNETEKNQLDFKLNVNIPGLTITKPVKDGSTLYIPFLAQYINSIYSYSLGIIAIIAAIMIVYGGFRYLIGASISNVNRGKEIITDAIIGLIILLSSFTLLSVFNESLISLKSLEVKNIERIISDTALSMNTTDVSTAPDESVVTSPSSTPVPSGSGTEPSSPVPTAPKSTSCPLNLPANDANQSRMKAFNENIGQFVTGGTFPERVRQVADFMVNCEIQYGNCNHVSQYVWLLAGAGDYEKCKIQQKAKQNITSECFPHNDILNKYRTIIANFDNPFFKGLVCDNDCLKESKQKGSEILAQYANRSDCKSTPREAMLAAKEMISKKAGTDYDEYIQKMESGDYYVTYTANRSCSASHSIVFIGWDGPGKAISIQGDARHKVSYKTYCISPKCGSFAPVYIIARAKITK